MHKYHAQHLFVLIHPSLKVNVAMWFPTTVDIGMLYNGSGAGVVHSNSNLILFEEEALTGNFLVPLCGVDLIA